MLLSFAQDILQPYVCLKLIVHLSASLKILLPSGLDSFLLMSKLAASRSAAISSISSNVRFISLICLLEPGILPFFSPNAKPVGLAPRAFLGFFQVIFVLIPFTASEL